MQRQVHANHSGLTPVIVTGQCFSVADSGNIFTPVGFNYDHDEHYRLLEDYWLAEWQKVVRDFHAMRELGANTVRIHLQAGKFLIAPDTVCESALLQLDRLVALATSMDLRLHIVGLSCYRRRQVPSWYEAQHDTEHWRTQAFFWRTLAARYRGNGTIFCFDLMNEPLVPARQRHDKGWLGADYHGSHFTQYISLDGNQAPRIMIAQRWTETLALAIREADPARLVTIGLVDWSLPDCKPSSGFIPHEIAPLLDFICLHIYPETGGINTATDTVKQFMLGKPLLIDETFPLRCPISEFDAFLTAIKPCVNGFFGFYTDQVAQPETDHHHVRNRAMQAWLQVFVRQSIAYLAAGSN